MNIKKTLDDLILKIDDEMAKNNGHSDTADRLKDLSIKAILGGPGEWIEYMRLFEDKNDPAQLARLIPTDGSQVRGDMQVARAYLIAGGPCGPSTYKDLARTVTIVLDQPFP